MKLKEFLENPAGKGDSSTNRTVLRQLLDSKYQKLVDKKGVQFKLYVYHIPLTDNYYIHITIPTETERDNTYDVVLLFETEEKGTRPSLLDTHSVKFFCNAPSFAYTFAKVFDENGLLIPSLRNKFPDEILSQSPEVRNRYGVVNYDKYLYFGCKYVYEQRILNRGTLSMRSIPYNPSFLSRVRTLDKIMIDYKKAQNKLKRNKESSVKEKIENVRKTRGDGIHLIEKKQTVSKHALKSKVVKKHKKT